MKNLIYSLLILSALTSCEKTSPEPKEETQKINSVAEKCGPYGKESTWKSVGGDTLYVQNLTLTFFFTEKNRPCNICYYQQNFALWNDYDYTFSVSECAIVNDTLTLIDIDTNRKAIFKREN